jgi:hypothetical protein
MIVFSLFNLFSSSSSSFPPAPRLLPVPTPPGVLKLAVCSPLKKSSKFKLNDEEDDEEPPVPKSGGLLHIWGGGGGGGKGVTEPVMCEKCARVCVWFVSVFYSVVRIRKKVS